MRTGTIERPVGAREPMIRLVGTASQLLQPETEQVIDIPHTPSGWDDVLHGMFSECVDTPLQEAGGELLPEEEMTFEERCGRARGEAKRLVDEGDSGESAGRVRFGVDHLDFS